MKLLLTLKILIGKKNFGQKIIVLEFPADFLFQDLVKYGVLFLKIH